MARPKKVPVTYAFGRRDRVDPKLAPFGVLKIGRNLRVRKDGRLGSRHGFEPLPMTTTNGDLEAFDLHEYRGRLLALGSDGGDGYPTELFEYIGLDDAAAWRGTDPDGQRVTVSPFTNLREVAGVPLNDGSVGYLAAAAGLGYVCLLFGAFVVIVDAATDQVIHSESLTVLFGGPVNRWSRAIFAGGVFYIAAERTISLTSDVRIAKYEVGADVSFQTFATVGAAALNVGPIDLVPVTNATTARLALAYARTGTASIAVFSSAGAQVGSTINVSVTASLVSIAADQTDNTIALYTREAANVGQLRTYNFAGTLLVGPTATTTGDPGFLCRLPAQVGFTEHVAVLVTDATFNSVVQYFDIDTHAVTATTTIQRAVARGKPISGQSASQAMAIAFPAVIGPDLATFEDATNALFFTTPTVAHMVTRDLRTAEVYTPDVVHLARDESQGHLVWTAYRDPGALDIASPVVSLVDFQSTARRESVSYGGLLYFAGATPAVYDGRFLVEQNFNEFPAIISATPSGPSSGDLTPGATYSYVVGWEYVTADGSLTQGPISDPFDVTMGAGQDRVSLVVQCPHTVRTALGDALYGADVSVVVYRTVWEPVSGTQGSIFRRCRSEPATVGMSNYGRTISITDGEADTDIADNAPVYTQADRGVVTAPLQHFAPFSCAHITATESRLLTGGLAVPHKLQLSKGAYIDEQFAFSPFSNFFGQVAGPVLGVRHLDGVKLVFTADRVYGITGDGPDDIGAGFLDYPREIPSPGGLSNAWSFLDAPDGLWFQLDDSKLFRMPRGGGAPTWEGIDIEDTLTAYPIITGTAKHRADNTAVFACTNVTHSDARFLVRDFRTENWFEDEPFITTDGAGVEAVASFEDEFVYLSLGIVYRQVEGSFGDGAAGLFINTVALTQPLYPFGVGGYGQIYELLLTGEYRDDCSVHCSVSYDDGTTFQGLTEFNLADLQTGQTVQRKWTLPQDVTSSIVLLFSVEEAAGLDGGTEGFVFNQVDLLVGVEEGLRELSPEEMA